LLESDGSDLSALMTEQGRREAVALSNDRGI